MKTAPAWLPWGICGIGVLYLAAMAMPRDESADDFHLGAFATLPVQDGGRVKPFDTFARVRLLQISHGQRLTHGVYRKHPNNEKLEVIDNPRRISPTQWALDTMLSHYDEKTEAFDYRVFRIDNDQVVNFLGLPERPGSWLYSWAEFADNPKFLEQAKRIIVEQEGPKKDDIFENKIAELWGQRVAFLRLEKLDVRLVPPGSSRKTSADVHWLTLIDALEDAQAGVEHRALGYYRAIVTAYASRDPQKFNEAVGEYQGYLQKTRPDDYSSARLEAFMNRFDPYLHCAILYGLVFLLAAGSWLGFSQPLQKSAFLLAGLLLVVHSWALVTRIMLTGRPPVTNLYSSAIFIGWGCVGLCLFLEWIYKNGIALVVGSLTGLLTLIVARNLVSGDTMEMLQAVLDTNFWLATHVICIAFGYTTMFVAGFLGILYIVLGKFTPLLRGTNGVDLTKMIYGVVCFATLLSFVGTVLGGIWADESWGRFWGWDPKENGALLIVIWAALVLHARWGGVVKARGMANLVIFGNCVTAWSWFGTNLLGVGLHSYGFMKGAMMWLLVFVFTQLVIIGIGCTPLRTWKSFASTPPPRDAEAQPPKSASRTSVAVSS